MCDWGWQQFVVAGWLLSTALFGPALRIAKKGVSTDSIGQMLGAVTFSCGLAWVLWSAGFFK